MLFGSLKPHNEPLFDTTYRESLPTDSNTDARSGETRTLLTLPEAEKPSFSAPQCPSSLGTGLHYGHYKTSLTGPVFFPAMFNPTGGSKGRGKKERSSLLGCRGGQEKKRSSGRRHDAGAKNHPMPLAFRLKQRHKPLMRPPKTRKHGDIGTESSNSTAGFHHLHF